MTEEKRSHIYTPETCPSKHWNDGTDRCADCGEDLNTASDPAPAAEKIPPRLDARELGTVLAALRYWQRTVVPELSPEYRGTWGELDAAPEIEIADDDEQSPLTADEIDALCERLNCGGDPEPLRLAVIVEGGIVQSLLLDDMSRARELDVVVIDHDTEGADESDLIEVPMLDGTAFDAYAGGPCLSASDVDLPALAKVLNGEG